MRQHRASTVDCAVINAQSLLRATEPGPAGDLLGPMKRKQPWYVFTQGRSFQAGPWFSTQIANGGTAAQAGSWSKEDDDRLAASLGQPLMDMWPEQEISQDLQAACYCHILAKQGEKEQCFPYLPRKVQMSALGWIPLTWHGFQSQPTLTVFHTTKSKQRRGTGAC